MTRRLALLLLMLATAVSAQPIPFDLFLASVEAAPVAGRAALVDTFWQRLGPTPLVESDTTAILLWRGDAATVRVLGDMGAWAEAMPLARIAGTDLWFRRLALEPDARLEYLFMVDDESAGFGAELAGQLDPYNPHRVLSGFGPFSELAMPGYAYPDVFADVRDGTPGSLGGLDAHTLPPGALPYPHDVWVYTPPGTPAGGRYPVVVFVDGQDYVAFAHVPAILDDLIGRGEISPVVAVFVDPPNRHGAEAPNRTTEYGLNDALVSFLADELVSFVDAHYRTHAEPAARAIAGASYGGLIAAYVPLTRPDVFGAGISQSGYHAFHDDQLIRRVADSPRVPVRLWLDVGTYETTVGAGMLPAAETDFVAANRRMRDALAARGYDATYAEYPEGHTWGNWRGHLADALRDLFPPSVR